MLPSYLKKNSFKIFLFRIKVPHELRERIGKTKLGSHKQHLEAVGVSTSSSQSEKTKALKDIERVNKVTAELEGYERTVLYPLATQQVEIDLDDGVKHNYPLFGKALKKVPGLSK